MAAGVAALLWCGSADAHLIDEIAQNIVLDVRTSDQIQFELTWALHDSHVEAFYSQAKQLGMAQERSDLAFATQMARAFDFGGCRARPSAKPSYAPRPGFRAWVVDLRCDDAVETLRLRRVDYRRAKTRTTLFIGVRVGEAKAKRWMFPPRLEQLDIPIGPVAAGPPKNAANSNDPRAEDRADGAAGGPESDPKKRTAAQTDEHASHGSFPIAPADHPSPSEARASRDFAWLIPPPVDILFEWAKEGARHLVGGVDHLLFLLAIVLLAGSARWLVFAVVCFSVGHVVAMGIALSLSLPGHPAIEVGVGLSIVWAGMRAVTATADRDDPGHRQLRTGAGVLVFGLIHGWAFGSELARFTAGTDGMLWPLASFGVGLDLAQLVWCGLWWFGLRWAGEKFGERRGVSGRESGLFTRIHGALPKVVALGGAWFASRAALVWAGVL